MQFAKNSNKLRISNLNESLIVDCGGFTQATLQFQSLHGNAWTTAVVTIRASIDGATVVDLPSVTTVSSAGIVYAIDVKDFAFLHLVVTTAEGTASDIAVHTYLNDYR